MWVEGSRRTTRSPEDTMAETHRMDGRSVKVPEFLREPLATAQARLEHFEEEAQRVFHDLMVRGRASRKDLEQMVHRLSQQDWSLPEMRQRLEKLRESGVERAAEWRGKAETFRAEALERMIELQNRAVAFLGVATREQVEELSKELDRLARRIEKEKPAKRAKKAGKTGTEA
jgi:polyhydroxyalkanoate synthesis regulator phasin